MGAVFVRRWSQDPGNTVLLNIESINIIDLNPPSAVIGVGSGTVCIVGEFEDGTFAASGGGPTEVFSTTNALQQYGSIGYQYGSLVGQNPCARQRFANGAITPEYWNGNGQVQLNGKTFSRLLIARVDTSVGSVNFTRLAYLTGAAAFRYLLVSGQVLQLDVGSGPTSATFTGTVASVLAVGGTYPTTFSGGQTLTLGYDGAPNFVTTFLAADQTAAQVAARINSYAGFAFAGTSGGQLTLTGLQGGLGGQVRVVAGSSGVLAQLGLTVATTLGSGNVANIAAVTPAEVTSIVQGAITGTKVEVDQNGALRISNTGGANDFIVVGAGTTATALGFVPGAFASDNGEAILVSGAGTYPTGTAGTLTLQLDNSLPSVTATIAGTASLATIVTAINAAFTAAGQGTPCVADGSTRFYIVGTKPGGTISVLGASAGAILTELGLTLGTVTGTLPPYGLLPAGTVVQVPGGASFVTMQDLDFEQGGVSLNGVLQPTATSYGVKIRFAQDDGTGVGVTAGSITSVPTPPLIGAFSVVNLALVNNALTEAQIDAQYVLALQSTINVQTSAKQINIIFSARQSNTVRAALKSNAINASAQGCYGRMAIVRTPLGTPEATALSTTAQPGVGAYRDQRTVYCYPQANTFVPIIALVGVAGGTGFNATGNIDVGADGFLACILSQLNPEENPGQVTNFLSAVNSIESSPVVQNFQIGDYEAFKAAGICALRIDDGDAIFQSGVTSVDPTVNSGLVNINRRRMADFIQDSIAISLKEFGKKLSTTKRRKAITQEIRAFLNGLAGGGPSPGNPNTEDNQRIDSFGIDDTQNDDDTLGAGLYRIVIAVRLLASLDSIVLQTTIGQTVIVSEILSPSQQTLAA